MRKTYAYKGPTVAASTSRYKPKVPPPPQAMSSKTIPPGVRRLSWVEMQKWCKQGLCFNCNKKFTLGHKCKVAQAFLIECEHPQEWDGEEAEPDMPLDWPAEGTEVDIEEQPEVSLHALVGSSGPQTLRIIAWLRNKEVSLLIDNGSTHNFISTRIAQRLQIPITRIDSFHMRVSNGVDIVLGVQWLSQLGKVVFDYKQLAMEFTLGGRQVCLLMQPGHSRAREEIAIDIQEVLADFPSVLQEPTTLPPSRACDHCIALIDEQQPVNVPPYRYAHHQKDEIEKQVKEMLNQNLIRPSMSPFSSPVLLVKKKDGYYCKFVRHYGIIAKPLTQFLKKGNFQWTDEANQAFTALKQAMTCTLVLAMPDFSQHFEVHTDASNIGIGAMLVQQDRLVAYLSKALGPTKGTWSAYAKEMLAIIEAVRVWRPYLLGQCFKIVTNQQPLRYLLEQ
ncbi:uncharacterized protein LOC127794776 [Diospyros lotus]|uniref:uncharacterized protein LOC127794776 n=1 Tax=Diospyros lotus TaxID=55363 RepID=UPI002251B31C|nr:uncharacterized protein LOC127794776 [Diospyros lotus]